MPNSLRTKIKKLSHDSKITEEDMKKLIVKLDGHDKELYNKAIDDIKEKLMQNGFIYTQHALDVFNEIAEQLKAGDIE